MTDQYRRNRWQPEPGRKLAAGEPFPSLADGCMIAPDMRVRHVDTGHAGRLLWVRWCHPDGADMGQKRTTRAGVLLPGGWLGTVAWDDNDPRPHGRVELVHPEAETPGFVDGPEADVTRDKPVTSRVTKP